MTELMSKLIAAQRFPAVGAVISLLIAAPLLAAQEEAGGGAGGLFSVNWVGLMVWTWAIFLVLFVVLRKFAWGPILGAVEAREHRIQSLIDQVERDREEAAKMLAEQRQTLSRARSEVQEILAEGRKAGEQLRAQLMEEAQKQRQLILERSREEIKRERDEALAALRREAIDLSISAASRVLQKNIDSDQNRKLVEEYLESLSKQAEGGGAA